MLNEIVSPSWPETGEDVKEVDPFNLNEDDRVYVKSELGIRVFIMGPIEGYTKNRTAKCILPSGAEQQTALSKNQGPIRVGSRYWRFKVDGNGSSFGPIGPIDAIRIVHATPTAPP